MLQQMYSPPRADVSEVASLIRLGEGRVCGDASSEASSDATEDIELPQCKIRRNYNCAKCTFFTQNPRAYLVHSRDVHSEKFKIYDCTHCLYASKHLQKRNRHIRMVHGEGNAASSSKTEMESTSTSAEITEPLERIEDMLEEVEDSADMDGEDYNEDLVERIEVDYEDNNSATEEVVSSSGKKQKFFSCSKCNYVTHIRSRFTKHVKYHSMPMIKCTMCDFRTPYKWNLDRHMKNHGGTGSFNCSMCNFTADIKQSLTVHEMNHHTPPAGQSVSNRRRNRVGASDVTLRDEAAHALVTKEEEEGSGDSRSSAADTYAQYVDIEMISCNSGSNDATAVDGCAKMDNAHDLSGQHSPNDESPSNKQTKKRPIPQLIPLNASTPNQKITTSEPPLKKMKDMLNNVNEAKESRPTMNLPDISLTIINNQSTVTKEAPTRKKNNSFFDKLKERLLTETGEDGALKCKNCGFESKCLSEHSVHEKNCNPQANRINTNSITSLGSTRCQNCRHRCKSSADLYVHMQTCSNNKTDNQLVTEIKRESDNKPSVSTDVKEAQPHPMENVVFVWNNINQEKNEFDMPLEISINEESALPDNGRNYDPENADENDGMNLSPTQAIGKKVFKCPHCPFWASTASRFHVHIVGHLNKKPFECSLCKYKSNWRWDITKHIKLKSARDPEHNDAKVLMTDETGRRNYTKYNKFLAMPVLNEAGENEFHYIDHEAATIDASIDIDEPLNETNDGMSTSLDMQPLDLHTQSNDSKDKDAKKPKRTLWKCKKCNYRDPSKEALLEHVREHSRFNDGSQDDHKRKAEINNKDPNDLAYRCGHCNQLSNWKHVIQRHCRLKHDGVIKVITIEKPKQDPSYLPLSDFNQDFCTKCPFKTSDKRELMMHLQQHTPSAQSIFKCYFCPFFVKNESELPQHLVLHGITDPEEYIAKTMGAKSPSGDQPVTGNKRHRCIDCPYETNSKSQYMYHEQFHRLPADTPYKCQECNYSVSKRHLLHQHMRVHGIFPKKNDAESELESSTSHMNGNEITEDDYPEEIPYVWVAAKNEFHKMYKCRYCSYVNSQKCKIPNHEKIHFIVFENSEMIVYKCLECKFTCDNAGRLSEHSKGHGEIYGRIYCPVDMDIPDEEQIANLRKLIEEEKTSIMEGLDESTCKDYEEGKFLYFCKKCPTRFFSESELRIHDKFHDSTYSHKCKACEYSVPLENQLTTHIFVHTDEYRTKTKMLRMVHNTHPDFREPILELLHSPSTSEITWVVSMITRDDFAMANKSNADTKHPKQYCCKQCPAKFFKTSTLNYHMGLHGGEGENKCKKCSYAVKNIGHLAKHELLHENEGKVSTCDYESGEDMDYKNIPLSGTDLFQRKTEAQKRVLIDKDKLVKPNDHFPPVLQADPQFGYLMHGNPEFIYPTYLKNGRQKEKRYKCHKCPSAFEKREQYKIHLSLHGSKQRYKCELCDYSVKYYANYVQHMRKHQMNDEAQAERKKENGDYSENPNEQIKHSEDATDNIKLAIKTMPKSAPKSDFEQFSISDQQTLRILQRRRSINNSGKETVQADTQTVKDRKLHLCVLCPYTNQRQDALQNHYRRHDKYDINNAGYNKCSYCDLVLVQSHFLRDHLKAHFAYQKNLTPQCFAANEDVHFIVTKADEESTSTCVSLDSNKKILDKCNEDKIIVQMSTGEIVVE